MSYARQRADQAHETLQRRIREALQPLIEKSDADLRWHERGDYVVSRLATADDGEEIRAILRNAFGIEDGVAVTRIRLALQKHQRVMEDIGAVTGGYEASRTAPGTSRIVETELGVMGPGGAFFIGGLATLGFLLLFGLLAVAMGGEAHMTSWAAVILFLIGGCLGLAYRSCYVRGWRRGRAERRTSSTRDAPHDSRSGGTVAE